MKRFLSLGGGLMVGVVLCAAVAGPARGDEGDDDPLAKQLLAAAEKHDELGDAKARYGQRAEIALEILEREDVRIDLLARIRDMNSMIATFPQNRRLWVVEQWSFFEEKLGCDRQLTAIDRELARLRFEEGRMYEQELQQAQAEKRRVRPLNREAMLNELQRVERERNEAVDELKEGIEAAARKKRSTPGKVLDGAVARLDSLKTPNSPEVERDFLPRFKRYAGGEAWLNKGSAPPARPKAPPVKPKKDAPRARKDAPRARKDAAPTRKTKGF